MKIDRRWLIPLILFAANSINYIDRTALSVAGPVLGKEFGFGPEVMGVVFSCFFYSYILCILPMGLLIDRFGARAVITTGMFIWSGASAVTGLVTGLGTLICARLALGVGESSSYPAANRIIREWAPRGERATMTAIFNVGSTLGSAAGIFFAALLITSFGWRFTFYVLGSLTFVWAVVWSAVYRTPEKARWLSERERRYIVEQREPPTDDHVHEMELKALLRCPSMWGLLITQGFQTYSGYLFLTWLPSYLQNVRHLALMQVGWLGMLPYLVSMVSGIVVGAASDRMMRGRDLSTGVRRKLMIVLMLISTCIMFVPFATSLVVMELLIITAIACGIGANSLNFALAADLIYDPKSAGTVFGLVVLGGNVFGFLAPILTGFIISLTHAYTLSFVLAGALLYIACGLTWFLVRRPLQPRVGVPLDATI
jgi:ACS family glucarate transporter-like MFS transporter